MKKPLTDKGFRAILKAKTEHLGGVRYERNYCPLTEREYFALCWGILRFLGYDCDRDGMCINIIAHLSMGEKYEKDN